MYILISETLNPADGKRAEGFFNTVKEAKEYADEHELDIISIYELKNCKDLA